MNEGFTLASVPTGLDFNWAAAKENEANRKHISFKKEKDMTFIVVGRAATFNGTPISNLGIDGKRKFENRILFMYLNTLTSVPLFKYA